VSEGVFDAPPPFLLLSFSLSPPLLAARPATHLHSLGHVRFVPTPLLARPCPSLAPPFCCARVARARWGEDVSRACTYIARVAVAHARRKGRPAPSPLPSLCLSPLRPPFRPPLFRLWRSYLAPHSFSRSSPPPLLASPQPCVPLLCPTSVTVCLPRLLLHTHTFRLSLSLCLSVCLSLCVCVSLFTHLPLLQDLGPWSETKKQTHSGREQEPSARVRTHARTTMREGRAMALAATAPRLLPWLLLLLLVHIPSIGSGLPPFPLHCAFSHHAH
jgi:hypothetical protein